MKDYVVTLLLGALLTLLGAQALAYVFSQSIKASANAIEAARS